MKAKNTLGIIFFPAYDWAISPTHPEREERLLYTQDQLREEGIFDIEGIKEYKPELASLEDVNRTHFCFPNARAVLTNSHLISAGGAIKAAQLVMEKKVDKAFALVRPPGHHAMKAVHGSRGFCNINIEAVMVEYIRKNYGAKKIAIIDTDCHHGDGTQDIYWHDKDVLFISLHQDGRTLYPGTGHFDEIGGPNARGKTINIPLPPMTSNRGFMQVIDNIILPILEDFKPDLIINSAGQDNHYTDPITNMNFSAQGYALLNEKLNPDIAVLEGGYSIQGALPYINLGIVLAMAGLDYSHVKEPDFDENYFEQDDEITNYIEQLTKVILDIYFDEGKKPSDSKAIGEFKCRVKNIYYDTDGIQEDQTEYVLVCEYCSGLLKIESESSKNPLSLGIEIPRNACKTCYERGFEEWEEAKKSRKYKYIKFNNKKDDEFCET